MFTKLSIQIVNIPLSEVFKMERMHQSRKHEIGYLLFQRMLDSQGGIRLNSRLIQELTTEADSI